LTPQANKVLLGDALDMTKTVGVEPGSPRHPAKDPAKDLSWLFVLICCAPLFVLRISILLTPRPLYDFIFYWASGHLFLTGGHPYSEVAMRAIVLSYGGNPAWPVMTFCPPWGMPVAGIMAILPFHLTQKIWFAASLVLDCFSTLGLWIYFGGETRKAWIAVLVAGTFIPMGGAEFVGQITPLMLASLTAFLLLLKSEQRFSAGLVLLGVGFKPHLLYLVFLALLFWIVKTRAWTVFAGAFLSYGIAIAAAWVYNPHSLDYLHNTIGTALNVSCGLGGALRSIFGVQHLWLQFLPCCLGVAWFLYYWARIQREWSWREHLPLVLLVSVSTSPYCWNHDFILILPALIVVSVHGAFRSPSIALAYLAVQVTAFAIGLPPAWASAAGILWIVFYCFAKARITSGEIQTDPDSGLHNYKQKLQEAPQ
jgi:hypothetical protein